MSTDPPKGVTFTSSAPSTKPGVNPYAPWIPNEEVAYIYLPEGTKELRAGTQVDFDQVRPEDVPRILCFLARRYRADAGLDTLLGALVRIMSDRGLLVPLLLTVVDRRPWWQRGSWRRAFASFWG